MVSLRAGLTTNEGVYITRAPLPLIRKVTCCLYNSLTWLTFGGSNSIVALRAEILFSRYIGTESASLGFSAAS
jgi:hypothetical protein